MSITQYLFVTSLQCQSVPGEKNLEYYTNPIFAGDYPDPGILRDGNDYYALHSNFIYEPVK